MEYTETQEIKERVVLVGVHTGKKNTLEDTTEESLAELGRLADTAGAEVLATLLQNRHNIETSTYIGEGKVEELKAACETLEANVIIVDDELTGSQVRNLERITGIKVIDRSMLILDIFASRAMTKEGKIQVELAQLKYLLPRLTGMGAALSRLGGGIGTRGPGETKLETDRRHIRRRIGYLEEELKEVEKHRALLRSRRKKEGIPVVALVGYTNAGKSSLLNTLTHSDVLAEDKLFATLDPTTRSIELSDGRKVLLVDTVGFIRKLPHHLIKAFKSTLEEAVLADILLHVVDSSSEEIEEHMAVVNNLLEELGAINKPIITVFNKIDLKQDDVRLPESTGMAHASVEISALTGKGIAVLLEILDEVVPGKKTEIKICIPYSEGNLVSQIFKECEVLHQEHNEQGTVMDILADLVMIGKIRKYIVGSENEE
ncbi:GTPase HflX [Petroclostridium sp. X23]|uniref:GTPase HflX n=1 Tax=Petroclostridium sp. X23 TaxID=3045146 RepID=UPI0024ADAB8C|nr:GTPase HflX [Petroclostridium sp. X23]WHH60733.1 GTPase HflX [Petroclostridium sp. X23]